MKDNRKLHRQLSARVCPVSARTNSERRAVRLRFSICLFIVVLAVFGWVMHRRLAQYDSAPQTVHQSSAIKACLTKRNPISVPSMHGIDAFAAFFLTFAVVATLGSPDNSEASLALRTQRNRRNMRSPAQTRPNLVHFFFFPPPSLLPVS
jgi:cytochrome b subunit of formate dehydrogenase